MIDRDSVIVTSDPIGYSAPLVGCIRLLKHCFACFRKHHSCYCNARVHRNRVYDSRQTRIWW